MISNVSIEMEKVLFRSAHKTKSQIDLKHSDGSISQRTGDQKLAKNDSNLIKRFLQLHKLTVCQLIFNSAIRYQTWQQTVSPHLFETNQVYTKLEIVRTQRTYIARYTK